MRYGKKICEIAAVLTACLLMTLIASGSVDMRVVYAAQAVQAEEQHEDVAQCISEISAWVSEECADIQEEERKAEEARRAQEEEKRRQEEEKRRQDEKVQRLLASLIYCEAGNQPYEGQVAVGAVVMNRVKSSVYPDDIYAVIYQAGQFGPAMTGWLDTVLAGNGYTETAMQAAADALAGSNPVGDCLYFGCGDYGLKIGDHFFH